MPDDRKAKSVGKKKKKKKYILIMGKYRQTIELGTNLSYTLYTVLANRFNVC